MGGARQGWRRVHIGCGWSQGRTGRDWGNQMNGEESGQGRSQSGGAELGVLGAGSGDDGRGQLVLRAWSDCMGGAGGAGGVVRRYWGQILGARGRSVGLEGQLRPREPGPLGGAGSHPPTCAPCTSPGSALRSAGAWHSLSVRPAPAPPAEPAAALADPAPWPGGVGERLRWTPQLCVCALLPPVPTPTRLLAGLCPVCPP